jgi:hypothetical protein
MLEILYKAILNEQQGLPTTEMIPVTTSVFSEGIKQRPVTKRKSYDPLDVTRSLPRRSLILTRNIVRVLSNAEKHIYICCANSSDTGLNASLVNPVNNYRFAIFSCL